MAIGLNSVLYAKSAWMKSGEYQKQRNNQMLKFMDLICVSPELSKIVTTRIKESLDTGGQPLRLITVGKGLFIEATEKQKILIKDSDDKIGFKDALSVTTSDLAYFFHPKNYKGIGCFDLTKVFSWVPIQSNSKLGKDFSIDFKLFPYKNAVIGGFVLLFDN